MPKQAAAVPPDDADHDRSRAVRRVIIVTLWLNLAVAVAKIAYGHSVHALSIRADGFHSLTDSTNNLVGLAGVWIAGRPADAGHPYGHHKFEVLAAGVVGLSLLAMAYDVARGAIERLHGAALVVPEIGPAAFAVLAGTLLVNVVVARWERRRGLELDSVFLQGDALHTSSDVLVTVGVLASVAVVRLGWPVVDVFAAIGIAGFIAWAGIGVLRTNLAYLADAARLDPEAIVGVARGVPGVASAHKVRTRGAPGSIYVDLHIQIAPHLDVVAAHRVTHWVIDAIKGGFSGVRDVLVHTEPAAPGQPYTPLPPGGSAGSNER
ncbi:MAG TPA: cation diffusion facilitator family transporter [Polyangiaceae bacterium]|nr:cation diffusion facilitator family transporter [Polyangiaceae bacterium]